MGRIVRLSEWGTWYIPLDRFPSIPQQGRLPKGDKGTDKTVAEQRKGYSGRGGAGNGQRGEDYGVYGGYG